MEDLNKLSIKLTDFGFATYFDGEMEEILGSPLYMPPEIVKHEKYTMAVDVWSAGVCVYIMLTGKPPFFGKGKDAVYEAIKNKTLNLDLPQLTDNSKDFLR